MNWIHCLDRFTVLWTFLDIGEWIHCIFGHCPFVGADSTVVQTLNISRQTFCVIGYKKDSRTGTFRVSEYWTDHRTDHRTDHGTDCWIQLISLTASYIGQVRVVSLLYHCMYH